MNNEYKDIWVGYINESKDQPGTYYQVLKNVSGSDITIRADEVIFTNMTPQEALDKHPNIPNFKKSIKVSGDQAPPQPQQRPPQPMPPQAQPEQSRAEEIADEIPF